MTTDDIIRVPFSATPEGFIDKYLDASLLEEVEKSHGGEVKKARVGEIKSSRHLVCRASCDEQEDVAVTLPQLVDMEGICVSRC